jgi:hypothetical protein
VRDSALGADGLDRDVPVAPVTQGGVDGTRATFVQVIHHTVV